VCKAFEKGIFSFRKLKENLGFNVEEFGEDIL